MGLFDQSDLEEQWYVLKQNEITLRSISELEEVRYNLGPTSEDVTVGEYFDRAPEDVRELEKEGLVAKHLEPAEKIEDDQEDNDEFMAVYRVTSIGEGLLEKDSLEEAKEWYRELEEWADEEYSR